MAFKPYPPAPAPIQNSIASFTETKWDRRFLALAQQVGSWSKDPGTQVGAVIVRPDRTVASLGYNGFPRGSDDVYASREHKLLRTVHAELNALLVAREPLHGCTAYVAPLCPCSNCAGALIQAGITRVVYQMENMREEWQDSFNASLELFQAAGVAHTNYLPR